MAPAMPESKPSLAAQPLPNQPASQRHVQEPSRREALPRPLQKDSPVQPVDVVVVVMVVVVVFGGGGMSLIITAHSVSSYVRPAA